MKFIFKIKNKTKGFTLIEALVYSGLLALFLFSSILFASNILGASGRVTDRNELLVNQEFVEKKLNWIIGQSNNITSPVVGEVGSTLILTGTDVNLFPAIFSLVDDKIILSIPNETNIPLTNNKAKVTEFSVVHISNQSSVPSVRITLGLSSINSLNIISITNLSYVASQ